MSFLSDYELVSLYFQSLSQGRVSDVEELRKLPFMETLPQLTRLRPHLDKIRRLPPMLRDELRQPQYAKLLNVYAAEKTLLSTSIPLLRKPVPPLYKVYKNVAAGIRHYQQCILRFWILVRRRIRHWRTAHTFADVPPFQPGEPLATLVRRNPYRVPKAAVELTRATYNQEFIQWYVLEPWVIYCLQQGTPIAYQALCTLVSHLKGEWVLLLNLVQNIPCISRVLTALKGIPERFHYELKEALLLLLKDNLDTKTVQQVLRLYYEVCRTPTDLRLLAERLERYVGNPGIVKDFVEMFVTAPMCVAMQRSSAPFSRALFSTKCVQRYYNRLAFRASVKICRFLETTYLRIKTQQERRKTALVVYQHAFETLIVKWRWRQAWFLRQSCAICWESGLRLKPLHRDWRHAVCFSCLEHIDCCPLCRMSLGSIGKTLSYASSVSYTSDYEDPYYDDDQMYQYD